MNALDHVAGTIAAVGNVMRSGSPVAQSASHPPQPPVDYYKRDGWSEYGWPDTTRVVWFKKPSGPLDSFHALCLDTESIKLVIRRHFNGKIQTPFEETVPRTFGWTALPADRSTQAKNDFEKIFRIRVDDNRAYLQLNHVADIVERACVYYDQQLSGTSASTFYDHVYCDSRGIPRPARWRESVRTRAVYADDQNNEIVCHTPSQRVILASTYRTQTPKRPPVEEPESTAVRTPAPTDVSPSIALEDMLKRFTKTCIEKALRSYPNETNLKEPKVVLIHRLMDKLGLQSAVPASPARSPPGSPEPATSGASPARPPPGSPEPATPPPLPEPLPVASPQQVWKILPSLAEQCGLEPETEYLSLKTVQEVLGNYWHHNSANSRPLATGISKADTILTLVAAPKSGCYAVCGVAERFNPDDLPQLLPVGYNDTNKQNGHMMLAYLYYDKAKSQRIVDLFDPNGPDAHFRKDRERIVALSLPGDFKAQIDVNDEWSSRFKANPQDVLTPDHDGKFGAGMCQLICALKMWSWYTDNDRMEQIHDTATLDAYYREFREHLRIKDKVFDSADTSQTINRVHQVEKWIKKLRTAIEDEIKQPINGDIPISLQSKIYWLPDAVLECVNELTRFTIRSDHPHPEGPWKYGDSVLVPKSFDLKNWHQIQTWLNASGEGKHLVGSKLIDVSLAINPIIPELGLTETYTILTEYCSSARQIARFTANTWMFLPVEGQSIDNSNPNFLFKTVLPFVDPLVRSRSDWERSISYKWRCPVANLAPEEASLVLCAWLGIPPENAPRATVSFTDAAI